MKHYALKQTLRGAWVQGCYEESLCKQNFIALSNQKQEDGKCKGTDFVQTRAEKFCNSSLDTEKGNLGQEVHMWVHVN